MGQHVSMYPFKNNKLPNLSEKWCPTVVEEGQFLGILFMWLGIGWLIIFMKILNEDNKTVFNRFKINNLLNNEVKNVTKIFNQFKGFNSCVYYNSYLESLYHRLHF